MFHSNPVAHELPGLRRPLGCAPAATSCSFDVTVALNAQGNGAFHTGTSFDAKGFPSGPLQVTIEASDRAAAGDGTPAPNLAAPATLSGLTTRFLFQTTLGGAVTGLAIHPAGEVIATTDGGTDTLYALEADRPAIRWSWGADAGVQGKTGMGAIDGPPVIDQGDAPQIIVAGRSGAIYAVSQAGAAVWHADTSALFSTAPALTGPGAVVVPAADSASLFSASDAGFQKVSGGDKDGTSSPLVLDGGVFLGNNSGLARYPLAGGLPGAPATDNTTGGPFLSLATDGTRLFAANASALTAVDQTLALLWVAKGQQQTVPSSEPTVDIAGKLSLGDASFRVLEVDPLSGSASTLFTLPSTKYARVPMQGSDGHTYYPRSLQRFLAYDGVLLSWTFAPPVLIWRASAMDCAGRLYAAAGNTVYALVTDDHGLADTAWPAYRRDARNTANAGAPKYGIATTSGCKQ